MLKKMWKHFVLITKHRWIVFKLCCKLGMPFRGLIHDLSKYSPSEFIESAKNYEGNRSAITVSRQRNGYSKAWLHHRGRNKHHIEYWNDELATDNMPIIPYKYMAEMICDQLAAGITYKGSKWVKEYQLQYWNRAKEYSPLNDKLKDFLTIVYTQISENGISKVLTKENIKKLYYQCIK